MKSPDKTPPVIENEVLHVSLAPTQEISEAAIKGMELEAAIPSLTPPQQGEAVSAVEAAVWHNNKRVNGLYTTLHARNSWMSIVGMNWKRLSVSNDSSSQAMTQLAAHCREKSCRIDFAEENNLVKEIYVW